MKYIFSFIVFSVVFAAEIAQACSVCFFGDPSQKANIALRQGIVTLLVILLVVLAFFVKFFLSIARRSRLQDPEGV